MARKSDHDFDHDCGLIILSRPLNENCCLLVVSCHSTTTASTDAPSTLSRFSSDDSTESATR
jgi:hypothetical protein